LGVGASEEELSRGDIFYDDTFLKLDYFK